MSKKKKARKGGALINIFSNNKIVIAISFVLAFIIWFAYSMTVAPERTRTISDVPIKINLTNTVAEQLGLKAYGYEEITVDVEISGKSHIVGQVTADDLVITVRNINQVDDAGYKTLQLSASAADGSFVVNSISNSYIEVYFDFPDTKTFEVNHIVTEPEGGIAADGYHFGGAFYGEKELTISGPRLQLDKITEVVAETIIPNRLNKTTSLTAQLSIRTSDGKAPEFISYDDSQVKEVSMSIQKTKLLKFMAEFDNAPDFYKTEPLKVSFSKQELLVAGADSQISSIAYFEAGPIDFKTLSPESNTFEFEISAPNGITVIDGTEKVTATVDMSNFAMSQIIFDTNNITYNIPAGYTINNIGVVPSVKIVAPRQVIGSLTSGLVTAEIDLSDISAPGTYEVELEVSVKNRNDCWAYGTYKTTIVIS